MCCISIQLNIFYVNFKYQEISKKETPALDTPLWLITRVQAEYKTLMVVFYKQLVEKTSELEESGRKINARL